MPIKEVFINNKLEHYYKCVSVKSNVEIILIMESIQRDVENAMLGLSEIDNGSVEERLTRAKNIEKKKKENLFSIFKKITGKNKF